MNFTILQQANSPYQDSRENKAYVYKPSSGRHPLPAGIYAWCKYIIDINHIYMCVLSHCYIDNDNPHRLLQSNILHLPQKLRTCVHRLTFLCMALRPFWPFSAPSLVKFCLKVFEGWSNESLQQHKASNNIGSGCPEQEWYGTILPSATVRQLAMPNTTSAFPLLGKLSEPRSELLVDLFLSVQFSETVRKLGGKERLREVPSQCCRLRCHIMNQVKDGSHHFPRLAIRLCRLNWCP